MGLLPTSRLRKIPLVGNTPMPQTPLPTASMLLASLRLTQSLAAMTNAQVVNDNLVVAVLDGAFVSVFVEVAFSNVGDGRKRSLASASALFTATETNAASKTAQIKPWWPRNVSAMEASDSVKPSDANNMPAVAAYAPSMVEFPTNHSARKLAEQSKPMQTRNASPTAADGTAHFLVVHIMRAQAASVSTINRTHNDRLTTSSPSRSTCPFSN
ncbi:hypothetical protein Ae201684P_006250 [Aphanomyces euteiches]|uniref:Uncharacterized protein n=1 Tax=Aphanomyces euteiches TaxID=100861 RepID=A0A6G0XC27_9STRA|nr:hypothetical protein Ae201684_006719 [Aphanomyces euteiches]KAH9090846.1 hypothetical protein Ae201684P_006250 [Aphanomyces euteiches]